MIFTNRAFGGKFDQNRIAINIYMKMPDLSRPVISDAFLPNIAVSFKKMPNTVCEFSFLALQI